MDKAKPETPKPKGHRIGDVAVFLKLTKRESDAIDRKIAKEKKK